MEADVRTLISGIAFKGEAVVASAFMDRSQLSENLGILKKLGRQYWDAHSLFESVESRIQKIKEVRNLFIHGIWSPKTFGQLNGFASVTDLHTNYAPTETIRSWTHDQTSEYTLAQFQEILDEVNGIIAQIGELRLWLEKKEGIEFGFGGITGISKPVRINIDGNENSD